MEGQDVIPTRLYKYRDFSSRTLDMVVSDNLYFSDPGTFNDPLDTRPCVHVDLDTDKLEKIASTLIEQRINAETDVAAKAMRVRGSRTADYIKRRNHRQADSVIADIEYNAADTEDSIVGRKRFLLGHCIEQELLQRYETGVLSLAERADCPLMWSHYGDQHRGMCMGYSVPTDTASNTMLWAKQEIHL